MSILFIILGAALLYGGGELLVRNAVHLARRLGLSSLVIGLTVVAFGTSAPELAATLLSSLAGAPDLAIGNVLGSNVANLGLILGLTALVYPLQANRHFLKREVPLVVASALVLFPVLWDGRVARYEGAILVALLGAYLAYLFRSSDEDEVEEASKETGLEAEDEAAHAPLWRVLPLLALGVMLLVFGAQSLVRGAVEIAASLGVPERVIGLTVVALGTSLPELASSLVAAIKRETDLLLGNVIGSNVFNVLAILGVTSLVRPLPVAGAVGLDLWVVLGFSLALWPLMARGARLSRVGGALFFGGYGVYTVFLFLN